jgi:hypothetical protein
MEHIMKSGTLGQFQANGDIVDDLDYAVGSHKSGLQLPRGRPRQGGRGALPESKKCPIAHLVRDLPMLPVVVELLGRLCLLQAVAYIS